MRGLFNSKNSFFRPLWLRLLTTASAGLWSVFEFYIDKPIWGVVAAGVTVFCLYSFFTKFEDDEDEFDRHD